MIWSAIARIFALKLELVRISRLSDHEKDIEILILRYQLGIADRKLNRTIKPDRVEKLTLAVLAAKLKRRTNQTTNPLRHSLKLFSPQTVIRWHNELVKRKWTYAHKNKGGRPRTQPDRVALIVRLARENVSLGLRRFRIHRFSHKNLSCNRVTKLDWPSPRLSPRWFGASWP